MDEIYAALRRADAVGDAEGAKKLASYIQSMPAGRGQAAAPNPTDSNSFFQNAAAGLGKGATDLGLGIKQRLDEGAAALERTFGGQKLNKVLGLKNAADIIGETQAAVDEKRKIDAPLMRTAGGNIGNFAAKAIPAVGAMALPGGQGLGGSMLTGAALGFAEPTLADESALKNAAFGGVGGAAGYGVGKGIGAGVNTLATRAQGKAAANALVDANTGLARDAGYVFPISQSNPSSVMANTLDIVAGGRPKLAQAASLKNQAVTNNLAAKAVGLPANTPLTPEALAQVRQAAFNQGYAPISGTGMVTPGPAYTAALDSIVSTTKGASNSFPGAVKNDIPELINGLRVQQFDAGDALKMTQVLRDQANAAYRVGDKALGKANKQAAAALEDAIETHLSSAGPAANDALKAFRDARTLMAKTFSVEKALNGETGNVSAQRLAADLAKGKPLTGELLSIAKMGRLSPKNVQTMAYSTPGASQLEGVLSTGGAIASANPLLLGVPYLRAGLRNTLLSKPVQSMMPAPSYGMFQGMTPQMGSNLTGLLGGAGATSGMLLPGLLDIGQ
jgi:hypothetical protein